MVLVCNSSPFPRPFSLRSACLKVIATIFFEDMRMCLSGVKIVTEYY